jgi:hypothetical protein
VPKPREGTSPSKSAAANKQISRIDRMRRDKITPPMPPNRTPQIIAWFIEAGMVLNTGMGPAPLSWAELSEWQRLTGLSLEPWISKLIRHLSIAYIAEKGRAEDESCVAPYRIKPSEREIAVEEKLLDKLFG